MNGLKCPLRFAWPMLMLGLGAFDVGAADSLVWRARQNRVDARIETSNVATVLSKVSAATGWNVYLEPGITNRVSTKFKDTPPGDALRLLLGNLNFALVPQRSGPAKLFVFGTTLRDATLLVPAATDRASRAIADERIVTLKPGAKENIDQLAKRLGAQVVGKIDQLNAYRLRFDDEAAARNADPLLADGSQLEADYNFPMDRPTEVDPLTGGAALPFNLKPKVGADSGQVIVGVIDTPVQASALPGDMSGFVLPGLSVAGAYGEPGDQLSHGTSMAETVLHGLAAASEGGAESTVRLLPVDIYGGREETSTFDVAKGVYAAINAGATIINLSLAGDGDNRMLRRLIQDARQRGVLFFAAAGNEPVTIPTFPAAYPEVVAVTAADRRGNIAPYANRGDFVDVLAPGRSLVQFNGESFVVTGTSASTAYVSGTAAAMRASGQAANQVEASIRDVLNVKAAGRTP